MAWPELTKKLSDGSIALAGGFFEAATVPYRDDAPAVVDEASLLKGAGGRCDAGPVNTQHEGDELLRQRESINTRAIMGHQEPSRQTLLDAVEPVAGGQLHGLARDRQA